MKEKIDIGRILMQSPLGVLVVKPAKGVRVRGSGERHAGTVYLVEGRRAVAIKLTRGLHALVDYEDAKKVLAYNWHSEAGQTDGLFYAKRFIYNGYRKQKPIRMHNEILNNRGGIGDHKSRNTLDNRRSNLRRATRTQNAWNCKKRRIPKTGFTGVNFHHRTKVYIGVVQCNGIKRVSGYFKTAIEAAKSRDRLAKKLHGRFAVLNFPSARPMLHSPNDILQ